MGFQVAPCIEQKTQLVCFTAFLELLLLRAKKCTKTWRWARDRSQCWEWKANANLFYFNVILTIPSILTGLNRWLCSGWPRFDSCYRQLNLQNKKKSVFFIRRYFCTCVPSTHQQTEWLTVLTCCWWRVRPEFNSWLKAFTYPRICCHCLCSPVSTLIRATLVWFLLQATLLLLIVLSSLCFFFFPEVLVNFQSLYSKAGRTAC